MNNPLAKHIERIGYAEAVSRVVATLVLIGLVAIFFLASCMTVQRIKSEAERLTIAVDKHYNVKCVKLANQCVDNGIAPKCPPADQCIDDHRRILSRLEDAVQLAYCASVHENDPKPQEIHCRKRTGSERREAVRALESAKELARSEGIITP